MSLNFIFQLVSAREKDKRHQVSIWLGTQNIFDILLDYRAQFTRY